MPRSDNSKTHPNHGANRQRCDPRRNGGRSYHRRIRDVVNRAQVVYRLEFRNPHALTVAWLYSVAAVGRLGRLGWFLAIASSSGSVLGRIVAAELLVLRDFLASIKKVLHGELGRVGSDLS